MPEEKEILTQEGMDGATAESAAPAPSSRDRLISRYKSKRPELDWDTEGANDIDALAADELDAYDSDMSARKEMDDKMNKLFGDDSRAAKVFVDWQNGKDPIENLVETYGDDFLEALQSEEGKAKFKEALEKWRTGKKAEAEHQQAYDNNIQQTVKNLIEFADAHGLSDEQMDDVIMKAHQLGSDVLEGLYTPELLDMVYKAGDYDRAVAEAKEEGRVNGKNEKIRKELRQSKSPTGLPPTTGEQSAVTPEGAPSKPRTGKLDMFGGIPVTSSRK